VNIKPVFFKYAKIAVPVTSIKKNIGGGIGKFCYVVNSGHELYPGNISCNVS